MVVFLVGSMNTSGLEISAAIAFAASLARLGRASEPSRAVWALAGASGVALALSRSTGPIWLAFLLLAFVLLDGFRSSWRCFRRGGRGAIAAVSAVAVAILANRWWESAHGPHAVISLRPWPDNVQVAIDFMPIVLRQEVGVFGTLDSPMPRAAHLVWIGMVLALVAYAATRGKGRDRALLVAATAGFGFLLPVFLQAAVMLHTGFAVQGRYVLPFAAAIPILAGEVIVRSELRTGLPSWRPLLPVVTTIAAVFQLVGWYWNARRQGVGVDGSLWFISSAEWWPPLGWWPWLALAIAGSVTLVAAGISAVRTQEGPAPARRAPAAVG